MINNCKNIIYYKSYKQYINIMEDTAETESLPLRKIILIGDADVGKTAL